MAKQKLLLVVASLFIPLFPSFDPVAPAAAASSAVAANLQQLSFSFDFSNPSSYRTDELRFEGNASVDSSKVDLTCNAYAHNCMGRMSYAHPVKFYDNATREVASFSARFTFSIVLQNGSTKGDGLAFFLSGYPSSMPPTSGGGNLGLINVENTASDRDRFVAVEFDTYNNTWDPSTTLDHMGIDISSRNSTNTTSLPSYSLNSGTMTAFITFDNHTRKLVAHLELEHPSFSSFQPAEVSTVLPDPVTSLLPPEVSVGFSASTGGDGSELHQIHSWSFNSTLGPASTLGPPPPPPPPSTVIGAWIIIVGVIIVGGFLLVGVWLILSCCVWKRRKSSGLNVMEIIRGPVQFLLRDLAVATDNFSEGRFLGEGGFGKVHRGSLANGDQVAVKTVRTGSDFTAELRAIGRAKHRNLVELKGWCRESCFSIADFVFCRTPKHKLFLVYELLQANLDHYLHDNSQVLSWTARYTIIKDIASALLYLHEECRPYILHRDIKPSNILLDDNFNAKLADFGLSRIADHNNKLVVTGAFGTEDYMDPLCMKKYGTVEYDRSSDIYSFGLVLLEVACCTDARIKTTRDQVWQLYLQQNSSLLQAADVRLNGEYDRRQMERVLILGLWCSFPDSKKRPTIREALDFLEHDAPIPDLLFTAPNK